MKRLVLVLSALACACASTPERLKSSDIQPEEAQASLAVRVFDQTAPQPQVVERYIGTVEAFSCKKSVWNKSATKGDAISQLRVKAHRLGANAIIGVTYDDKGADAFGTNCWESVFASGTAVALPE